MTEAGEKFASQLRAVAEKKLELLPHAETSTRPVEEILHELKLYQIELEMQNEELRRAQLVVEESRDRYADFYDFAPVGYITLSREAMIEEINLTAAAFLGTERAKLLHHRFADFIAPEDRDSWYRYFVSVLRCDDKLTCELAILGGDGSRQQVQLESLRLLRNNESSVVHIVLTDIAERHRAEQAEHEQEELFRLIAENIDDFIAVLDLQGIRVYNTPSYIKIIGDTEALKGTNSFAEIHPDDREYVQCVFNETVKTGIGLRLDYRLMQADGSVRYLESSGGVIKNSQGQTTRVVVVSRDVTERKLAEEQILNLAFYDTLTQLPNRRLLDDRLNQAVTASKRTGRYGALMFLDMDNFKPLNDLHGHAAGDLLLKEVANRISGCVRKMDTVARFGGDEFVVMLVDLDTDKKSSLAQTSIVAEKIRATLAQTYVLKVDDEEAPIEHHCTASIGVVMFVNQEYIPADLLDKADMVMYQAKESGSNRVVFFDM